MADPALIHIGTHDGSFHVDEVLAVAILTTVFSHHQITRTRDPDILDLLDIVVDVGDVYDHTLRRYDHHMHDPPMDDTGHMLSSAGLIWRHYGRAYLHAIGIPRHYVYKNKLIDLEHATEDYIRIHWIHPVDRADNGLAQGPTHLSEVVRCMRPIQAERSRERYDQMFLETVSMVSYIFKRSCFHSVDYIMTKMTYFGENHVSLCDDKLLVLSSPPYNTKMFHSLPYHFVVAPTKEYLDAPPYWVIRPVMDTQTRNYRTSFPKEMSGRRREYLEEQGVMGIFYIHHGGFMAMADSREAAMIFCERLLGKSSDI